MKLETLLADKNPSDKKILIWGCISAFGTLVYCGLVAWFFMTMEHVWVSADSIFAFVFMLFLLVLSAAITGSLVLGYPALLTLKGNTGFRGNSRALARKYFYCTPYAVII